MTGQFEVLANAARDAKDNRTLQFLLWFIEEQVEEERMTASLLDLIDSGINLFDAQQHLDSLGDEAVTARDQGDDRPWTATSRAGCAGLTTTTTRGDSNPCRPNLVPAQPRVERPA